MAAVERCGEIAGHGKRAELCHLGDGRKPGRGFICRREMQKRGLQKWAGSGGENTGGFD